jgi:AcrR family transcriptional regulator
MYILGGLRKSDHRYESMAGPFRREGRSREVWEVALTMFAERGYRGTTTRDIAQELGIQAPSLYNYMRSKQEILRDVMLGIMERALVTQRIAVAGVDDVAEQLRRMAEEHARLVIRYRREVLVTHREIPNLAEPDRAVIGGKQKEYVRGFRDVIERGCSLGRFGVESPRIASVAVLEMLNGLERWYRDTGPYPEDDVVRQYGEFALRIVGEGHVRDGHGDLRKD